MTVEVGRKVLNS